MNEISSWEQIPKVKTSKFKKNQDVSILLENAPDKFKESKSIKILENIYKKNTIILKIGKTLEPHEDLMNIISDVDLLLLAYRKLSRNKGALTPGSTNNTADNVSIKSIQNLSKNLKNGTFKWTPIRRVKIPKPGKKDKRPLGIIDFDNKMVQEAIRLTLEAIYEPIFRQLEANYGFRPKRDCIKAIRDIRQQAQFANLVIEGDINSAYDNVNHKILIRILKRNIKDAKFLKLIEDGLKAGIMEGYTYFDTFLGLPQGGIASPILFNIYFHEFDKFIINNLSPYVENLKSKSSPQITTEYARLKSQIFRDKNKLKSKIKEVKNRKLPYFGKLLQILKLHPEEFQNLSFINKVDELIKYKAERDLYIKQNNLRADPNAFFRERTELRHKLTDEQKIFIFEMEEILLNKVIRTNTSLKLKTPYTDYKRRPSRIYYKRYADDFTIWCSGSKELVESIKTTCATSLKEMLNLDLNPEKTKITDIRKEKVRFLGFEIYKPKNPVIRKTIRSTQRFFPIQVNPDKNRLLSRFKLKKYIDQNKDIPREVGFLTLLEDHEIITKFNQFMTGIGLYYIPEISTPSRLNKWHNILYFCCIKTLATKHRLTVKATVNKYGYQDISIPNPHSKKIFLTDIRICSEYKVDDKIYWSTLLNYKEFMYMMLKYRAKYRHFCKTQYRSQIPPIDFSTLNKVNFRTKFKITTKCTVCGSNYKLENHHIKPLKHSGGRYLGYKGFDKLIASLGRKQITVCSPCHDLIDDGKYDGLALSDLYDVRLATPESHIKLNTGDAPNPNLGKKRDKKSQFIFINKYNRTYLNLPFQHYLRKKYEKSK